MNVTIIRYTVKIINQENKRGLHHPRISRKELFYSRIAKLSGRYADNLEFEVGYLTSGKVSKESRSC